MFKLRCKIRGAAYRILAQFFGTIVSVDTRNKEIAITFDDGPHPEYTPKVLDVLLRYNAKATFFMLGIMAEKYPDLVNQVVEAGHEVGNHSWDHPSLLAIPAREVNKQLIQTKQLLAPFGQTLMRPPFGHQNIRTYFSARQCGYKVIGWNLVAEDWLDKDAKWIADKLIRNIKPGSIILFHDSLYQAFEDNYRDREATIGALEILLRKLANYKFLTVSELLANGTQVKRFWYQPLPDDLLGRLRTMST